MRLTKKSREMLDDFIAKQDVDERVTHALADEDVIELALYLLVLMNETPMSVPIQPVFNLAVARWLLEMEGRKQ
jgi:hypothetical protein